MKNHLQQMKQSTDEIVWLTDDPDALRYLLFQAFAAAEAYAHEGEPYLSFAQLKSKFKIRVGKGKVKAEPRRNNPLEAIRAQVQQKVVIKDATDTAEIIAALSLHNATELVFQNVDAADLNLVGLYEVAKKHKYYMIPASTHITFSKQPEDADIAWTPEEA